jgi:hypothetical protein
MIEPLPAGSDATGRIAAPAAAGGALPASIQSTVRSRGGSRGSRGSVSQDPLPER